MKWESFVADFGGSLAWKWSGELGLEYKILHSGVGRVKWGDGWLWLNHMEPLRCDYVVNWVWLGIYLT